MERHGKNSRDIDRERGIARNRGYEQKWVACSEMARHSRKLRGPVINQRVRSKMRGNLEIWGEQSDVGP